MNDLILYTTEDGRSQIKLRAKDETVWLTQLELAELFAFSKQNIGQHLKSIFEEGELVEASVVKQHFTTAADGHREVHGLRGIGMERAFSPRIFVTTGFLGRCPRLVWRWAVGPETQTAPTARFHTSLGQRPRYDTPTFIEG